MLLSNRKSLDFFSLGRKSWLPERATPVPAPAAAPRCVTSTPNRSARVTGGLLLARWIQIFRRSEELLSEFPWRFGATSGGHGQAERGRACRKARADPVSFCRSGCVRQVTPWAVSISERKTLDPLSGRGSRDSPLSQGGGSGMCSSVSFAPAGGGGRRRTRKRKRHAQHRRGRLQGGAGGETLR